VRLFTRRGFDWTDRYPAIASAAAKLRAKSFADLVPPPLIHQLKNGKMVIPAGLPFIARLAVTGPRPA
jgi:hypothetical protein